MDRPRNGVPALNYAGCVDLHLHSTASDGECSPAAVVQRAASLGLSAIALTDHDSVNGVSEAAEEGRRLGIAVIGGCEFSVTAPWGELHVLGYFLGPDSGGLSEFLDLTRSRRATRAEVMVQRLRELGVRVTMEDVLHQARGGAVGRPHVGRALVRSGAVTGLHQAFERYLGRGKPAFVPKVLPPLAEVCERVRAAGGLTSAAHLGERGTRTTLKGFKEAGLDAVETRHPSHDPEDRARLTELALELGLLRTGGSDWHGDGLAGESHGPMGSQEVPHEWLERLQDAQRERAATIPGGAPWPRS